MKIYVHEDHMEQGNVYMKHLSAMTKEQLHSKADIAGELAGRDILIAKLANELERVTRILDFPYEETLMSRKHGMMELSKEVKKLLAEQDLTIYKVDSLEYDEQ